MLGAKTSQLKSPNAPTRGTNLEAPHPSATASLPDPARNETWRNNDDATRIRERMTVSAAMGRSPQTCWRALLFKKDICRLAGAPAALRRISRCALASHLPVTDSNDAPTPPFAGRTSRANDRPAPPKSATLTETTNRCSESPSRIVHRARAPPIRQRTRLAVTGHAESEQTRDPQNPTTAAPMVTAKNHPRHSGCLLRHREGRGVCPNRPHKPTTPKELKHPRAPEATPHTKCTILSKLPWL